MKVTTTKPFMLQSRQGKVIDSWIVSKSKNTPWTQCFGENAKIMFLQYLIHLCVLFSNTCIIWYHSYFGRLYSSLVIWDVHTMSLKQHDNRCNLLKQGSQITEYVRRCDQNLGLLWSDMYCKVPLIFKWHAEWNKLHFLSTETTSYWNKYTHK